MAGKQPSAAQIARGQAAIRAAKSRTDRSVKATQRALEKNRGLLNDAVRDALFDFAKAIMNEHCSYSDS